ncbi:MAG: DUF881 domain-containing protein [Clostridia bacterium]|nr:DUF881 domain-containing protein [Clostridia bacterium]
MKKGKITITITIGLACFILVLIIFMQFKVIYQTDIASIDMMRAEELKTELSSWKSKYEEAEEKYNEISKTLKKYKEESSSGVKTKQNLQEELANLELLLGLTDVEGIGIEIILKDPENIDELEKEKEHTEQRITASELIRIVNFLKDSGAEAISINNQRIVNKTDFAQINDTTYIKINSQMVSAPFTIKAIGDSDYLKASLIGTGYVTKIKDWGQTIDFKESKNIRINKYNGNMDYKYIEN